jgi:hypothetical protein
MFWKRSDDDAIQRLNLVVPDHEIPSGRITESNRPTEPRSDCITALKADPAKVQEIQRRAAELLKTGLTPRSVFLCRTKDGLVGLPYDESRRVALLLFSSPYLASDYVRVMGLTATVGELGVERLHQEAERWISAGSNIFLLNRCPRCQLSNDVSIRVQVLLAQEQAAFHQVWAIDRAKRMFFGGIKVQAASALWQVKSYPESQRMLEEVRDHIDCGVPYLHQMIAFLAGMQGDETAKSSAAERLMEFGPQFTVPAEFSIKPFAAAMVGLMQDFWLLPVR